MEYISESEIAKVLRQQDLIPLMRQTMIDFSLQKINQPTREIFEVQPHGGFFGSMPAAGANALGAKLVAVYPKNADKNRHTHMAVIVLFRPETGEPLVIMDGRLITEMRTAAVSATFIDAVAPKEVSRLTILGAGIQAKSHFAALSQVRDFTDIRLWNRTPERAIKLAREMNGKAIASCEEAVRNAEVVIVATSSTEPVLRGEWLSAGTKVATVGWSGANGAEVDAQTMAHTVIVDSRAGAQTESGNIRRYNPTIYAELGEILDGRKAMDPDSIVVFDSIGMACQDIATAGMVYEKLRD